MPSLSSPGTYPYEYGRWRFQVKKAGRYRLAIKVPPSGAACGFDSTKYTTGARYMLARPGGSNVPSSPVNQRASIGQEAVVFADVVLPAGESALYLYDSVTDLSSCCDTCGQSIRVMFDYAKLDWLGP
jgi:hypothetical protein